MVDLFHTYSYPTQEDAQMQEYRRICEAFFENGDVSEIWPFGEGHINSTFLVHIGGKKYILQRINTSVFSSPDAVMQNIHTVTRHLAAKGCETLEVIPTADGELYHRQDDGCYRMYTFIENTVAHQSAPDKETLYHAGRAFGQFQNALADLDAGRLKETIADFHNTPKRYENFRDAVTLDRCGRLENCLEEVRFITARGDTYSGIVDALGDGSIPMRITHNDTKLNNILMDRDTGKARAIVDLDTVMPGSLLYDFGDAIRSGAAIGAEDEQDLGKVQFDIEAFAAYTEGYLAAMRDSITEKEAELLPYSAYLMTMECGMRFLTDYLAGDTYFATKYPEHNLHRCRTQLKLASEMEKQLPCMAEICKECIKKNS